MNNIKMYKIVKRKIKVKFYCEDKIKKGDSKVNVQDIMNKIDINKIGNWSKKLKDIQEKKDKIDLLKNKQNEKQQKGIFLSIEKEPEPEHEIKKDMLIQQIIKKTIHNQVDNFIEEEEIKNKKIENVTKYKEFLVNNIWIMGKGLLKNSGFGSFLVWSYKLWSITPKPVKKQIIQSISITAALSSVVHLLKMPVYYTKKMFGRLKWKETSSTALAGGTGLELINKLNEQGADIIQLNNKSYSNIKEVILNKIDELTKMGIEVNDNLVEQLIIQGKGVILNKYSLEPLIQDMSVKQQQEILYNIDFFGDQVANEKIIIDNIPGVLSNPINAVHNINEYTSALIEATQSGTGNFNIFNYIIGIVILGTLCYFGYKYYNNILVDNVKSNIEDNKDGFNWIKLITPSNIIKTIFGGFTGIMLLPNKKLYSKEDIEKIKDQERIKVMKENDIDELV